MCHEDCGGGFPMVKSRWKDEEGGGREGGETLSLTLGVRRERRAAEQDQTAFMITTDSKGSDLQWVYLENQWQSRKLPGAVNLSFKLSMNVNIL